MIKKYQYILKIKLKKIQRTNVYILIKPNLIVPILSST